MPRVVPMLLIALLIVACDGVADSYKDRVALGRSIFEAECASCHGAMGRGTAWGGDLRSKLQGHYSYAKFSSVVMSGRIRTTPAGERKVMPRFADRSVVTKNLEEIYFYLSEEAWPPKGD